MYFYTVRPTRSTGSLKSGETLAATTAQEWATYIFENIKDKYVDMCQKVKMVGGDNDGCEFTYGYIYILRNTKARLTPYQQKSSLKASPGFYYCEVCNRNPPTVPPWDKKGGSKWNALNWYVSLPLSLLINCCLRSANIELTRWANLANITKHVECPSHLTQLEIWKETIKNSISNGMQTRTGFPPNLGIVCIDCADSSCFPTTELLDDYLELDQLTKTQDSNVSTRKRTCTELLGDGDDAISPAKGLETSATPSDVPLALRPTPPADFTMNAPPKDSRVVPDTVKRYRKYYDGKPVWILDECVHCGFSHQVLLCCCRKLSVKVFTEISTGQFKLVCPDAGTASGCLYNSLTA